MKVNGGSYQSGTVESFTYNLQNKLTGYQNSKTTASYTYGANGLRKSKTVGNNTTNFVWDRGNLAAEVSGSTTNIYNYGPDGITTRETSGRDVTLYLKNAHSDVVGTTDKSGNTVTIIAMMHLEMFCQNRYLIRSATAVNTVIVKAA